MTFSGRTNPATGDITEVNAYTYVLYTYDDANNTVTVNNGGNISTIYYDNYGREIKTECITPAGTTYTQKDYDSLGNVAYELDALTKNVEYAYNNRSQLISEKVYDYDNDEILTTTYTYDNLGRNTMITSPKGNETTFEYDDLNRLLKSTNPLGNTEEFVYNGAGYIIKSKDKNGVVTTNTYDVLGNVTRIEKGNVLNSYTYDTLSRLTSETNANGYITYIYSGNDLERIVYLGGKNIYYTYDDMGNVASMTDADGNVYRYGYNPLYSVYYTLHNGVPLADYTYNQAGLLTKAIYHDSTVTPYTTAYTANFTYDNAMNVTSVTNKAGNNIVSQYNYTYDLSNNVATKNDGTTLTSYTYDLRNRLTNEEREVTTGTNTCDTYNIEYTYDDDNNITKKEYTYPSTYVYNYEINNTTLELSQVTDFEENFSYDDSNRLTNKAATITAMLPNAEESSQLSIGTSFTYDNNGNMLSSSEAVTGIGGTLTKNYTYNVLNQLTEYRENNTVKGSYTYYPNGYRKTKTVGGTTTSFYWDRGNIVNEGVNLTITASNVFDMRGIARRHTSQGTEFACVDVTGTLNNAAILATLINMMNCQGRSL